MKNPPSPQRLRRLSQIMYILALFMVAMAALWHSRIAVIAKTSQPQVVLTKERPQVGEWLMPGFPVEFVDLKVMGLTWVLMAVVCGVAGEQYRLRAAHTEQMDELKAAIENLKGR